MQGQLDTSNEKLTMQSLPFPMAYADPYQMKMQKTACYQTWAQKLFLWYLSRHN